MFYEVKENPFKNHHRHADPGDVVSRFTYSLENPAGFSIEKIDLYGGDESTNWTASRALNGTPGFANSVTPHSYDLGLLLPENEIERLKPIEGQPLTIQVIVHNPRWPNEFPGANRLTERDMKEN